MPTFWVELVDLACKFIVSSLIRRLLKLLEISLTVRTLKSFQVLFSSAIVFTLCCIASLFGLKRVIPCVGIIFMNNRIVKSSWRCISFVVIFKQRQGHMIVIQDSFRCIVLLILLKNYFVYFRLLIYCFHLLQINWSGEYCMCCLSLYFYIIFLMQWCD